MTYRTRIFAPLILLFGLAACEPDPPEEADILAIGDSLIWWNSEAGQSIADVLQDTLGMSATNAAIPGAAFLDPDEGIPQQYVAGPWQWVVLDGGANDLGDDCGTLRAEEITDALISADLADGRMPAFFRQVRADGPRIVIMGYYSAPVGGEDFGQCPEDFARLNDRLARYAAARPGVYFAPAGAVIDPGNRDHYDPDLVHPSPLGSRLIGKQIAEVIRNAR